MFRCGSKGHDNCTLGQQLSLRSALLGQRWVRLAQHRLEVPTYAVADKADCAASRFHRKRQQEGRPGGRPCGPEAGAHRLTQVSGEGRRAQHAVPLRIRGVSEEMGAGTLSPKFPVEPWLSSSW